MLGCGPEEVFEIDISTAPDVENVRTPHSKKRSFSPRNRTAEKARSNGRVLTIREACETVVKAKPLN